jgi:hypothetical protein
MNADAGWSDDPSGVHELRYWDGERWTDHVSDGGSMTRAPLDDGSSTFAPSPPPPIRETAGDSGWQLLALFKNRWVALLALFFVGIPIVIGVAVVVTHGSRKVAVEPFDSAELACETWWRANVSAARDGWDDARLRREVGRVADSTESVDAQLSQYWRAIATNPDLAVVRANIEMAYQRCVDLQWRGATDAELAIIGGATPTTR